MKKLLLIFAVAAVLLSCEGFGEKKYIYTVTQSSGVTGVSTQKPIKIYAKTDSAAFIKALDCFEIQKSVVNRVEKSTESKYISYPISFELTNSAGRLIYFADIEAKYLKRNAPIKSQYENRYEILGTDHSGQVENFYVLIHDIPIDKDTLTSFDKEFRKSHCTKKCNINIIDRRDVYPLIMKYPLKGKEYIKVADNFVALSSFDGSGIWMYPFQDTYYKEQGGANWKIERNFD